jgi:eukaryotic-like serine/threonine-protein kinase
MSKTLHCPHCNGSFTLSDGEWKVAVNAAQGKRAKEVRSSGRSANQATLVCVRLQGIQTMPANVTLAVVKGKLRGQQFVFDERTSCVMGRADDCQPRLPDDAEHKTISRHHCLLDVNPPDVRVRDFGSLNGTYVNGQKIGQRDRNQTPEEGARRAFPEYDLKDGDELELGDTTFRVHVFAPVVCDRCGREIPQEEREAAAATAGVIQCESCRRIAETADQPEPPKPRGKVCIKCGRDVAREIGDNRHGEFICAGCKADPMRVMKRLLELAATGDKAVAAIQGYEILRELGRGGMGAVYLARHERTGEQVALKVMLPQVATDQRAKTMFLREVENTRALCHPHVVRLHEFGCSQGTFFFTLEYCDGGSAARWVQERGGRVSPAEALPPILQVLDGLEYAHGAAVPAVRLADGGYGPGQGLVHRDLKPHNLFLSGSGASRVAKIGDYGLAKAFDQAGLSGQTRTGAVAGTPVFMPRQQVVNFKYARPEVDVWAAAASLYWMLTGRAPRDFSPEKDPWQVVLQTSAVPIRTRAAAIPARLAEVIDLALIDKPAIHFKTAAEFKRALEGVL